MDNFIKKFNDIYATKCNNYPRLPSILPAVPRIIVIGDIHGDMDKLIDCLKIAKLINKKWEWIGKDTVVVQVGDQIDSCRYNHLDKCDDPNTYTPENDKPADIKILYFMTKLHNMASKHGGAVYSLMGNHEFMNVSGDMSYVSHKNLVQLNNMTFNGIKFTNGTAARQFLFKPGNQIANFLACTRKVALVIGSNLFVHAGIIPIIAEKYKIEDINMIMSLFLLKQIEHPDVFSDLFINGITSPLWTRVYGSIIRDKECNELLQPLKDIYNVNNIYVGHTPQVNTGISSQCKDRVWMTDVGMSYSFDMYFPRNKFKARNAQVLEILDDGKKFNILK
jgi:hypothetical protein